VNVCLFGATGRVGSVILENLLMNGFQVNALVRDPMQLDFIHKNINVIEGNACNQSNVRMAMKDTDIVISGLNTDGKNTLSLATPIIIEEMKRQRLTRIISIGTAGILQSRSEPHLYRFQSTESRRKTTKDAEDHLQAFLFLKESQLDWTIVCPTYLPVGERLGKYRFARDVLPENPSSISVFDTADFAYSQIWDSDFIKSRVGLTY
jgi:uncharacterized protein